MADAKVEKPRPWLRGIVDTFVGARHLRESLIGHRNRLVVILLDSALETGCRAFLRHEKRIKLDDSHRHRENLMKVVKAKLPDIDDAVWKSIDFYYEEVRCDLYHQSAFKTLTETSLDDYQETIYFVIDNAFGIRSAQLVDAEYEKFRQTETPTEGGQRLGHAVPWRKLPGRVDKVIAAISRVRPRGVEDLNSFLRQEGVSFRLDGKEFTNIVARNAGSRKYFYFDRANKQWQLSGAGRQKLEAFGLEG